jgi:hypothetical protein
MSLLVKVVSSKSMRPFITVDAATLQMHIAQNAGRLADYPKETADNSC